MNRKGRHTHPWREMTTRNSSNLSWQWTIKASLDHTLGLSKRNLDQIQTTQSNPSLPTINHLPMMPYQDMMPLWRQINLTWEGIWTRLILSRGLTKLELHRSLHQIMQPWEQVSHPCTHNHSSKHPNMPREHLQQRIRDSLVSQEETDLVLNSETHSGRVQVPL